jgi:hypothetical protein
MLPRSDGENITLRFDDPRGFAWIDETYLGGDLEMLAIEQKGTYDGHRFDVTLLYRELTGLPGNALSFRVFGAGCWLNTWPEPTFTGHVTAQLVELVPPTSWLEFLAYQWPGPPVKRVLYEFTSTASGGLVDVTGVTLIGLRLVNTSLPDDGVNTCSMDIAMRFE